MIVVLSDLHFRDRVESRPLPPDTNVPAAAFELFWRHVDLLGERVRSGAPVTIVLNGDILEILRSERWFADGTRPYNFDGAPSAAALRTAAAIADSILDENAPALAALARTGARFVYVFGNHDRLLRHPALERARARLATLLGGDLRYVELLLDDAHALAVRHGHELDWTNSEYQHARSFEGLEATDPARRDLAPLGDWIGLEIGTRLPRLAWEMLHSDDHRWDELDPPKRRELCARLSGLEDVHPPGEVLSWLIRPAPLLDEGAAAVRATTERFLGDLMNELVAHAMPQVEPWLEAHRRPLFDRLALGAVGLLGAMKYTVSSLPSLMDRVQAYFAEQDRPWTLLPHLDEWRSARYRYYAGGHTHQAKLRPLEGPGAGDGDPSRAHWYVNTGSWRRAILRGEAAGGVFGTLKQIAFAVFYDEEETARSSGREGTSFDFWQGATQRF